MAWKVAALIGTSLLKASTSGQEAYPQAFFPFEGKTDLIASGKWLSLGEKARASFLVYSLRSCSHPFPFKALRYDLASGRTPTAANHDSDSNGQTKHEIYKRTGRSSSETLTEHDASNRLRREPRSFWKGVRFPDLYKKTIWKNRVIATSSDKPMPAGTAIATSSIAVGDPGSEKRIRPIDLQLRLKASSPFPVPRFLEEIVEELKELENFSINLMTDSTEDGWTVPILLLSDEYGEINPSLFVYNESGDSRERRVSIFSIFQNGEQIFLVAIEDNPVHVKPYLTSDNSPEELWQAARCAAGDFIMRREPKQENIAHLVSWVFSTSN
jgi:hypothetical protein